MTINVNAPATTGTAVDWADITNKPTCFPPCAHGWSHPGTQADPVPLVTPTDSGLIPAPPTGAGVNIYFAGDLQWHNLSAQAAQIVTLAGSGLVPALTGTVGQYFSATSPAKYKQVDYSELTGLPVTFPASWATIVGKPSTFAPSLHAPTHALNGTDPVYPDWTQVQNKPATFPPSPHAPTHVTGGADIIPSANTSSSGLLNSLSGLASEYVGGDNACHSLVQALVNFLVPAGVVVDFAGATPPAGWLLCNGASVSRAQFPNLFAAIGTTYGSVDANSFTLPDDRSRVTVGAGQGTGLSNYALGAIGGEETHFLTTAELPVHSHNVTDNGHTHPDSGHNHTLNDPTHGHGINQSPHTHVATSAVAINYGTSTPGYTFYEAAQANTSAANANVSVAGGGTGCYNSPSTSGLGAAQTGVTLANTGSGAGHNVRQPYRAYNKIIKV